MVERENEIYKYFHQGVLKDTLKIMEKSLVTYSLCKERVTQGAAAMDHKQKYIENVMNPELNRCKLEIRKCRDNLSRLEEITKSRLWYNENKSLITETFDLIEKIL